MDKEIKRWITVKGVHVPIFEGQSARDAVKAHFDPDGSKGIDYIEDEEPTVVDPSKAEKKETVSHRTFTDKKSVNDFFFYDDERRGLLVKRNSTHGKWEQNLTPRQREVLNNYTADGYSNINSYLRGYDNGNKYSLDFVKSEVAALDKAIADYELREPIVTYRCVNSDAFSEYLDDISKLIGTEYSDPAFMSSSPSLDSTALNKDLTMVIKLPKGKGIGAYINEFNGNDDEIEFLIARGSKYKITNAYKKNKNNYYVEMELMQ